MRTLITDETLCVIEGWKVRRMREIADQLHSGSDKMRDLGSRLILCVDDVEVLDEKFLDSAAKL
jgi:hypothetical protein